MKDDINNKNFYNVDLIDREGVYAFISQKILSNDSKEFITSVLNKLKKREEEGSIKISEHVLLPHIQSNKLLESQVLFIKLKNNIANWNEVTENIQLIIVVALKEEESIEVKKKIVNLMKLLADDEYLIKLLNSKTEKEFSELTNIF